MEIVLYPDPRLRKKTAPIESFDADLQQTIKEMFEVMYKLKGVGLAAPQVGLSQKLLLVNPTGKKEDEMVFINPTIRSKKGEVYGEEGCLSFPGMYATVARGKDVVVDYHDAEGNKHERALFSDWVARIIQHENDHLEGILFTDRMSPADKARCSGELKALEEHFAAQRANRS